jgi:cytochrome c peroxidase
VIPKPIFVEVRLTSNGCRTFGHNGYFKSLKEIVHFYNTRDVLPRCAAHDPGEGTSCWPAPETTENMNKNKVGNLGLSDNEEDALVSFLQTPTDGYNPAGPK